MNPTASTRRAAILGALAALALAGCSPLPIHTTFDTLTNETTKRASDLFNYSTFISLSGLVPQQGVQLVYHQPDFYDLQGNAPSYAVGISPTRSFISERKFAMSDDNAKTNADAVRAIRDGLETARLLSVSLAATETRIDAAQSLIKTVGANAPDAGQADTLKTLLGNDAVGADGKIDSAKTTAALARLSTQKDGLKDQIAAALAAAKSQAARSNVVITRWEREKRSALNTFLSEAFAFAEHGNEAKSGTLVFGDLRVVTLHSGEDLVDMLRSAPRRFLSFASNAGITSFSIQARHMAYSADLDMQRAVSLQLQLSKEQLAGLSATFKDLDLKYSSNFGVAMDVSNSAFVTDSQVQTEGRCFFPPELYTESIRREIAASNGYQDLYVVRVQIKQALLDAAIMTHTALADIAARCSENESLRPAKDAQCRQDFSTWLASCERGVPGAPTPRATFAPAGANDVERMFGNLPYKLEK